MKPLAYAVIDHHLTHLDTMDTVPIDKDSTFSLSISPVHKSTKDTIFNALTNALSSSVANGNEKIRMILTIRSKSHTNKLILNKEVLVRNSLDYHESIRAARRLIKQCRHLQAKLP